jgi:phosphonate transport system substrate-binding protein
LSTITFAIVPSTGHSETQEGLDHLAAYLSEDLGVKVAGRLAQSYAQVVDELERDHVQFAWMPPVLHVLAEERLRLLPLCSTVRAGKTRYYAALFVDARSRYRNLDSLMQTRVAWVDATSASGYLYPRVHLQARGIDPTSFFKEELFLGSHGAVVRAVLEGRADVGATFAERPERGEPIRAASFVEVAPEKPVRVLDWTGPIPNDLVVAHGLQPMEQCQQFARSLLQLGSFAVGRNLLHGVFRADGFVLASHKSLRPLSQMVRQARRHGLLSHL